MPHSIGELSAARPVLSNMPTMPSPQLPQIISVRYLRTESIGAIPISCATKRNPVFSAPQCGHSRLSEGMLAIFSDQINEILIADERDAQRAAMLLDRYDCL